MSYRLVKLVLRWYQQKCVDTISSLILKGINRILVVSPAGSGKGSVIAYLAAHAAKKNNKVLISIHRKELVLDIAQRLKTHYGIECGIIMAGHKQDLSKTIQVGSVMSVIRRDIGQYDVGIFDEAHHIVSGSQRSIIEKTKPEYIFGFTATPTRHDTKTFDVVFDDIIQLSTYIELMKEKYLVPTKVYTPKGMDAYQGVKLRIGEFVQGELEESYMKERLYKGLYDVWCNLSKGKSTLIFNVRKKHNYEVYKYFKDRGESVAYIDDTTKSKERDRIVSEFKSGKILIVCSIFTLTEGFDAPVCKTVILNYATKVVARYIQSACRGSRPIWDGDDWLKDGDRYVKDHVLIIDCGGNTHRHGRIEHFDMFGFDLSGKRSKMPAPTKSCPQCDVVVFASSKVCKHCGYVFPVKKQEDEKKFADEVEFSEMVEENDLALRILNAKHSQIKDTPLSFLRIVAVVKGYKPGWVRNMFLGKAQENAHFYPANKSKTYIKINQKLKKIELDAGVHELYLNIKTMYGT